MTSKVHIRRAEATLTDAEALLTVERQSLKDSPYTPAEVQQVLLRPEHYAYLAWEGAQPVGFCSCFETPAEGGARLEIDLLGVVPERRGRGLGTRLIRHSMAQALRRGLHSFRAVVAVDNIPSQTAFRRAGFAPEPWPRVLLVYEVRGVAPQEFLPPGWRWQVYDSGWWCAPDDSLVCSAQGPARQVHGLYGANGDLVALAECLEVYTLAYCGLWVERCWACSSQAQQYLARALVEQAKTRDLDEVGYLAPSMLEADEGLLPWLREGYQRVTPLYTIWLARCP